MTYYSQESLVSKVYRPFIFVATMNNQIISQSVAYENITWDSQIYTCDVFDHTIGGSGITIKRSGWYRIIVEMSINATTSARSNSATAITRNGEIIPHSQTNAYHKNSSFGTTNSNTEIFVYVDENDVIEIRAWVEQGKDIQAIGGACRFIMEQMHDTPNRQEFNSYIKKHEG